MEQNKKIVKMDEYLSEAINAIHTMSEALNKCETGLGGMAELMDYYGTEEWLDDAEAYEKGNLSNEVEGHVFVENAVFHMCMEYRNLAIRMLELGTVVVKEYGI